MPSHNMTWITYPSKSWVFTSPEELEDFIASQNVISRLMHCYIAFFVPAGLIAGICILFILIKNYFQQKVMENLNLLLLHFTISSIIMIFLSFTIVTRPDYVKATHLTCNVLSFFFNFSYFNSQYVLIFMLLLLLLERFPPRTALSKAIQRPVVCVGFVATYSFCLSLTQAILVGTGNYHLETDCQLDPLFAQPEYEIIKFTFGFGLLSFLQILSIIILIAKEPPAESPSLKQHIRTYPTAYIISITTFVCHLFYNVMILFRATLKLQRSIGTPKNELVMNIAETVLFCGSCTSLVLILFFHKPCRAEILKVIRKCRRQDTAHNHLEMPITTTTQESGSQ